MNFELSVSPVEVIKKVHLLLLILETFILVLMIHFTKTVGKNLKNEKVLTKNIMPLIFMMLVLMNLMYQTNRPIWMISMAL